MSGFAGRFPLDGGPFGISAAETAATAQTLVGFDGRLDNREDLLLRLSGSLSGQKTDCALALGTYEKWGVEGLIHLIGDWGLAVWEQETRTILLASNRRVDVTLSTTGQESVKQFPFNAADSLTLIGGREKPAAETKKPVKKRARKKPANP